MEDELIEKRENSQIPKKKSINNNIENEKKINIKFSNEHNCTFDNTLEVHIPSPDDAALPHNANHDDLIKNELNVPKNDIKVKKIEKESKEIAAPKGKMKQQKLMPKTNPGTKKKTCNLKKTNPEPKNKTITDYFPVRRSDRRTLVTIKKEKQKEVEDAILSGKEDGFEIKEIIGKGRGVVSKRLIKRGEFVLEYHGDLIDMEEAKRREKLYSKEENTGCYMYYFTYNNKHYCVDATKESGRLGRLVNHSKKGNLKTESFAVENKPHLILVARQDIQPGEELLYDYGDRSKKSLEFHPWLAT